MTNEKAQARLQQLYNDFLPTEYDFIEYDTEDAKLDREAIQMAIKALEQQSVIDKIRAEIEAEPYISKMEVLDIIDKYKAESEG